MKFGRYYFILLCLIFASSISYSLDINSLDSVSRNIFKKGFFLGWQMRKREHICGSYIIPSGWWVYMDSSDLSSYKIGYYKFIAMRNGLTPLDGIGDVVFGVFDSQEDADHTKELLQKDGVKGVIRVEYKPAEAVINPCVNFDLNYGKTHLDKTLYFMKMALYEAKSIVNPSVNKKALIHDITTVILGLEKVGAKIETQDIYKKENLNTIKVPYNYQNLIERSKLWAK